MIWRPTSWGDVKALLGLAEESSSLDFKRELSSDNRETSKDIAAMTLNGGVLIYGIDEDKETGLASEVMSIPLAGVEEKLHSIAGTRIAPSPDFTVELLRDPSDQTVGVAVVVIPPSPFAPHQCDHRYPVRRGTTTDYLTEPEVERLYHQRNDLSDPPLSAQDLLAQHRVVPSRGHTPQGEAGTVVLIVRPVSADAMHPAGAWQQKALESATAASAQRQASRLANASLVRETWNALASWRPMEAQGWLSGRPEQPVGRSVEKRITATLTYPATLSFLCEYGIVVGEANGSVYKVAREDDLVYDLLALLAIAGEYFSGVDGGGQLLAAIRLSGFSDAVSKFASDGGWRDGLPGAPDGVTSQTRTSAIDLRDDPAATAKRLINTWLPAFFRDPHPDEDGPRDLFDVLYPAGPEHP